METAKSINPRNIRLLPNSTHMVIVKKQTKSEDDKALKNKILDEYKYIYGKVHVVRDDQINDNIGRGLNLTGIEFRTFLTIKKYEIVATALSGVIGFNNNIINES